jgi:carboxymethylenebutenolidase
LLKLVIQEWWGLNDQIKGITSRFSKAAGIVAIAPDLYRGKVTDDSREAGHLFRGLDWKKAIEDIVIVKDYLSSNGVREITVLGFCMGGALALASACKPGFHSGNCISF